MPAWINEFLLGIDALIYRFIVYVYELFFTLADARFFSEESLEVIFNRVYLVIGVVMLFIVAYSLLSSIVDPDKTAKSHGSPGKIIFNIVFSLALVVVIPQIFNFAYQFQHVLLNNNVIGNIVLGTENGGVNTSSSLARAGGTFAQPVLQAFLYVDKDENGKLICPNIDCELCIMGRENVEGVFDRNVCSANGYTSDNYTVGAVTEDTSWWEVLGDAVMDLNTHGTWSLGKKYIKEWYNNQTSNNFYVDYLKFQIVSNGINALPEGEEKTGYLKDLDKAAIFLNSNYNEQITYGGMMKQVENGSFVSLTSFANEAKNKGIVHYSWPLSTIAGLFVLWILFSFTIDMALRLIKLGFYELIAPIPIMARALPGKGNNIFNDWVKVTLATFMEVVVRLFTITFAVLAIKVVGDLKDTSPLWSSLNKLGPVLRLIAIALIVMGIVMFMKELPKLISKITGIDSKNMKLGIKDKLLAGGAFTAAGAIAGATRSAVGAGGRQVQNVKNNWKNANTKRGKVWSAVKGVGLGLAGGATSGASGFLRGGYAARNAKGIKEGVASGNAAALSQMAAVNKRNAYFSRQFVTEDGIDVAGGIKSMAGDAKAKIKFKAAEYAGLNVGLQDVTRQSLKNVQDVQDRIWDICVKWLEFNENAIKPPKNFKFKGLNGDDVDFDTFRNGWKTTHGEDIGEMTLDAIKTRAKTYEQKGDSDNAIIWEHIYKSGKMQATKDQQKIYLENRDAKIKDPTTGKMVDNKNYNSEIQALLQQFAKSAAASGEYLGEIATLQRKLANKDYAGAVDLYMREAYGASRQAASVLSRDNLLKQQAAQQNKK